MYRREYLVMTKCLVLGNGRSPVHSLKIKYERSFSVFLLFIFLFRIYFKKAIFVTYNFVPM